MVRRVRGSVLFLAVIALGAMAILLVTRDDDQSQLEISPAPRLSEEAVRVLAGRAAENQLSKIGMNLASLEGAPISISQLELREMTFSASSREIASSLSSYRYGASEPADLWLVLYQVDGVDMHDWGISNGVVEVQVVISDETGEVGAAGVLRLNPSADA